MNRWYTLASRLMLAQLILLAVFGVAELAARGWLRWGADERAFLRYASLTQLAEVPVADTDQPLAAHRYLGYYPTPGYRRGATSHNALGYRGPEISRAKPPGEFRIACLGGADTYTTAVEDDAASYPAVLEQQLRAAGYDRVTVINAGCEGWTSWESLINLEMRVLDLDPDLVILDPDVDDVPPRVVWPAAAYRGDNSGFRTHTVPEPFEPSVWESSTLLRMLMIQAGLVQPHSWQVVPLQLAEGRASTAHDEEFARQWADDSYPSGLFAETALGPMLGANRPVFYRRNLENMVAVARKQGVDVLLTTVADAPAPGTGPAADEYRRALAETNAVTRQVAERTGATLFDLAESFPEAPPLGPEFELSADGARAKATLIARFLLDQGLIPDSARSDP